jgi:hypothetical protein
MAANVGACAVAGIGSLAKAASAADKADQLGPVPRHNVNKETESNETLNPAIAQAFCWQQLGFVR